ncbi:MAG: FtsW/RodA/SpoVE family cell cycle protein [Lachnospiraceae bacterium]
MKLRRRKFSEYYDLHMIAVIVLLICFGLVMLYSTTAYVASIEGDDMSYLKRQSLFAVASLVFALVISLFDYHLLLRLPKWFPRIIRKHLPLPLLFYFFTAGLLALVPVLGTEVNGAKRWYRFAGIQFQPSELAKIAVILVLAYYIVKMGKQIVRWQNCLKLLALGGAQSFLTLVCTSNLSTAVIIFGITLALIFVAHPKTAPFVIGAVIAVVVGGIALYVLINTVEHSTSFRIQRILVWLHPEDFASGDGYQILQALYAIGSGGFFGKGLGNGTQKLGFVPEAQNDMIFSIICEELGIFGAIVLILLFVYLLYRLAFIARNAPDLYGSLLVIGIFVHIALQVILNISVVTKVVPTTGITLPFISYGGTALIMLMGEMGIALSVSRRITFSDQKKRRTDESIPIDETVY